jgi:hypothetical protein
MPHNPTSIVRSCTENALRERKPRQSVFSQTCQQQFDIRPFHRSSGQATCYGMPGMATGAKSSQNLVAAPVRSDVVARSITKWDGPPPFPASSEVQEVRGPIIGECVLSKKTGKCSLRCFPQGGSKWRGSQVRSSDCVGFDRLTCCCVC